MTYGVSQMDMTVFRRGSIVLASLAALVVAACGGGSSSGGSSSAASPTPKAETTVKTASKTVAGKSETILVDAKGITLYYFLSDKGGTVTCTVSAFGGSASVSQFTVKINVHVVQTGAIQTTGTVSFNGTDTVPGNNSQTVTITAQ